MAAEVSAVLKHRTTSKGHLECMKGIDQLFVTSASMLANKKNAAECKMSNSVQEETDCPFADSHFMFKCSLHRQVGESNGPSVQAEDAIEFRSDDGMANKNSNVLMMGGDACSTSPVALLESCAVEEIIHRGGSDSIDDNEDCIDGRVDGPDDKEASQTSHKTGPPIRFGNPALPIEDSTDVSKVAVTVTEQRPSKEAINSWQSNIAKQEPISEVPIADGDKKSASILNLSTTNGEAEAEAKQICCFLDRQNWAINYYKDRLENCVVVGIRNITASEARKQLEGFNNCVKYLIEQSSIGESSRYVSSIDPIFPLALRSSSVIESEKGHALLTGVLIEAVRSQLRAFTVGHLFEKVTDLCYDRNGNEIGKCSLRKVTTPEDQQTDQNFVDVAIIDINEHGDLRPENVNSLPSLIQLGQLPSDTVEVNYTLCFDLEAVRDRTKVAVLVLTQDRKWKRGIIPSTAENIKLIRAGDDSGELRVFKQCMRIMCRDNEMAAVTDLGDSGALVVLDPFEYGPSPSTYEHSPATPLVVVGFVVGMEKAKTFSVVISAVDALLAVGFSWKDWSFYNTSRSKDESLHSDSGVFSGISGQTM